jgi:hypothetical protein
MPQETNLNRALYRGLQTEEADFSGVPGPPGDPGDPGADGSPRMANAKADFDAVGDGVADDTAELQATIDGGLDSGGDYDGAQIPVGVFLTDQLTFPPLRGGQLIGVGPIDFVEGEMHGTRLVSDDSIALDLDGPLGFLIAGLTLEGDGGNWGIHLSSRTGSASGVGTFERMVLRDFALGVDAGTVLDGDHAEINAADLTFRKVNFYDCTTGFRTGHDQAVNNSFYDCSFAGCTVCFSTAIHGGGIHTFMLATYDSDVVLQAGEGGPNIGASIFVGGKFDGTTWVVLYQQVATGQPAKATFIEPHFNVGQLASQGGTGGDPRIQLTAGHVVKVFGGENFCDASSAMFGGDGGTLLVIGARLPSSFAQVIDGAAAGIKYRFIACVNESTGALLPDRDEGGVLYHARFLDKGRKTATCTGAGDQALYTLAIPANTLGTAGHLRYEFVFRRTTGAGSITCKVKYGGTTIGAPGAVAGPNYRIDGRIWNDGATNAQRASYTNFSGASTVTHLTGTAAQDSTAAKNLTLELDFDTDADVATLDWVCVEWVPD